MATSLSQLTLRDLMDAGLHFGHQTKRWNPKMKKYIYDKRNGVHIVDITQSLELLDKALAFAKKTAEDGGKILFVGTKKQAQEVVKTAAGECGSFYMTNRWLGGTLTNAQTIRKSVRRMRQLQKLEAENGGALSPHKKEAASLRRELDKLQQNLVGIADMDRLPAAVYVVDVVREKNAVLEATRLGIPVIAIVDTNADPDPIAFPIPGNDDSIRAIKLVSDSIARVVKEGASAWERKAAEETRKAEAERTARRASAAVEIAREKGDLPAEGGDAPAPRPRRPRAAAGAGTGERRPRSGAKAAGAAAGASKTGDKIRATDARRSAAKAAAEAIKATAAKAAAKPAKAAAKDEAK
jgi:small subunit ribosomal protein S2